MNELLVFLQSLPEAIKTGFIYAIMVMGVYITYKILDFPDMSTDGTFPLGGFVFAAFTLSPNGFFGITNPIMGLILAVIAGMIAGAVTGALHVHLKINGLLSGILVMTGLYSVNSRIVGMPNVFISPERNIFDVISYEKNFIPFCVVLVILLVLKVLYDYNIKYNKYVIKTMIVYLITSVVLLVYVVKTKDIKLMFVVLMAFFIKMALDYILTSKFGFALRALGNNEQLVISLGVNEKRLKIFGLMLANGLVALSGSLFAQSMKVVDLISGQGTLVIGLAAIILGLGILKKSLTINEMSIVTIGSLVYYFIINLALMSNTWTKNIYKSINLNEGLVKILEIKPTDVKIITAIILGFILWNENMKKVRKSKIKMKEIEKGE